MYRDPKRIQKTGFVVRREPTTLFHTDPPRQAKHRWIPRRQNPVSFSQRQDPQNPGRPGVSHKVRQSFPLPVRSTQLRAESTAAAAARSPVPPQRLTRDSLGEPGGFMEAAAAGTAPRTELFACKGKGLGRWRDKQRRWVQCCCRPGPPLLLAVAAAAAAVASAACALRFRSRAAATAAILLLTDKSPARQPARDHNGARREGARSEGERERREESLPPPFPDLKQEVPTTSLRSRGKAERIKEGSETCKEDIRGEPMGRWEQLASPAFLAALSRRERAGAEAFSLAR